MITEREKLEFESLPEFVREPRVTREAYSTKPVPQVQMPAQLDEEENEPAVHLPKTKELEALWPGVNHEFLQATSKKGPSFYLTIGFMAGALVSLTAAFCWTAVSHFSARGSSNKEIVVAQAKPAAHAADAAAGAGATSGDGSTIVPLTASYQVASGDTLAGIALKNYHRATPRLLDEICQANSMRNANVLKLGQQIVLPEYHPQSRQIASGGNEVQQ